MTKLYNLVVFDWEGTLGDTLGPVLNTIVAQAELLNLGKVDDRLARQYLPLGLLVAVKNIFPDLSLTQHENLLLTVQTALLTRSVDAFLLPGAKQIVEKIHHAGKHLAIATNRGQQSLQRTLKACELEAFFTVTRAAGQAPAKPCPQMLEEIMETCNVTPVETLMVGDSLSDIEMAVSAQVDAIGVNFYQQPELAAELKAAGAMYVFDDYQQLADYLEL